MNTRACVGFIPKYQKGRLREFIVVGMWLVWYKVTCDCIVEGIVFQAKGLILFVL